MSNYQTPPQPASITDLNTDTVMITLPGTGNTFWAMELEIGMAMGERGLRYSLSEAEILLDALSFYRDHQLKEMEEEMRMYATRQEFSQQDISRSMTEGDLSQKLDQIKVLNTNIFILGSQLGTMVREIAGRVSQAKSTDRA